jgi:5-formyltetrahydrofolate cyclo-ligase
MRARRAATSPAERSGATGALAARLVAFPALVAARRIAGYVAVGGEPPLEPVAEACLAAGKRWLLPVLARDRAPMRFAPWHPACAMAPNRHAIPEPVVPDAALVDGPDLDVVLLPLVAFDRHGHRLGSGSGYYDRTFAFLTGRPRPAHPVLVGIGWSFQEAELAAESWDIPVDWVVTERELIRCDA